MAYEEILTTSTGVLNTEAGGSGLINKLSTSSATPTDADYYISQYSGGGTSTTSYHRRPHSALWTYIKGKADGTYAANSHTHNYAGSSSVGGSATSAVKLDTSTAGSATQPVYFTNGKPSACTYTLAKSVPSNAVFTDTNTTYSAGTALSLSGTTFNHSNYATAGTAGTSSATSGSTLAVPYITVNAQGHVTGYGTHTHTISGFLTTVTKANVTSALGYTPCRAWTVTVPSGSSGSKAITVSGATFGKAPLIAKSSGTDTDYSKITAVSASENTLTFTLSSATSADLTLIVIETF